MPHEDGGTVTDAATNNVSIEIPAFVDRMPPVPLAASAEVIPTPEKLG